VSEEFIGKGLGFPLRTDVTGGLALVAREREIEEAIRIVLATAPGERPMRPEFGCRIHDYVFAPADESTAGLVAYEVRDALRRWEPRVEVAQVLVHPDPDQQALLWIDVEYTIRHTNDPRNLVFPFYVIPEESDSVRGADLLIAMEP
jgi:phage baseplate assembly protein W